ncbi:hypothetical protein THAOC_15271, partial [Thalassiosira oceanica]
MSGAEPCRQRDQLAGRRGGGPATEKMSRIPSNFGTITFKPEEEEEEEEEGVRVTRANVADAALADSHRTQRELPDGRRDPSSTAGRTG